MTEESMKILKTAECPSLSSRSELTYNIGCKGKEVYLCLSGNSGSGKFNKGWISLTDIEKILAEKKTEITSGTLKAIYKGGSSNSGGFMLAVIVAEGLVTKTQDSKTYEKVDPAEFKKSIQALMAKEGKSKTGSKKVTK